MSVEFDADGCRVGAEVSTLFQPWCESCKWFGPTTLDRALAAENGRLHDVHAHGAACAAER